MGEVRVPAQAYYGAQTQRAVENFPISGWPLPPELIHALGLVKYAAAVANRDLGKLTGTRQEPARRQAGRGPARGLPRSGRTASSTTSFPIDVFQTGSGTSSNMNANEVIANRAIELLGRRSASRREADPSQRPRQHGAEHQRHVPHGDSRGRGAWRFENELIPALQRLRDVLADKAKQWDKIIKIGRTHLADATPIRLGQEFSGYAPAVGAVDRAGQAGHGGRAASCRPAARPSARASTRIPSSARSVAEVLAKETGIPFVEAVNHFEANANRDGLVECSGDLRDDRRHAVHVANNIRWLGSGPRCGFYEIMLPDRQPGSSIMPGKVNPVMCESMMQVCARVIGNDQTVAFSGATGGNFELNIMMPVMGTTMLESCSPAWPAPRGRSSISARWRWKPTREACEASVEKSLAMVTSLNPHIGYERAAAWPRKRSRPARRFANCARSKRSCPRRCSTRRSIRGA